MIKLNFPFVNLPTEFVTLLRSNLSVINSTEPIFNIIHPNRALFSILETAFKEFNDGRGLEKVMTALGWTSFRDRMASIYISKSIYGDYPTKTNIELVEDIQFIETRFSGHSVNGFSRLFLLGFYLKLANLEIQSKADNKFLEIVLPNELEPLLKISPVRSEKIDWLILILFHLNASLGEGLLTKNLIAGKKFEDLYMLMSKEDQEQMGQNLMAYSASIQESEVFLYEKV
jgi:hypothetical protein